MTNANFLEYCQKVMESSDKKKMDFLMETREFKNLLNL